MVDDGISYDSFVRILSFITLRLQREFVPFALKSRYRPYQETLNSTLAAHCSQTSNMDNLCHVLGSTKEVSRDEGVLLKAKGAQVHAR
jgi:hypothetical protein